MLGSTGVSIPRVAKSATISLLNSISAVTHFRGIGTMKSIHKNTAVPVIR